MMPELRTWDDFANPAGFTDVMALHKGALARIFAEAQAEVDQYLMRGKVPGEPYERLSPELEPPTAPLDRALATLAPELRRCPLYDAAPRTTRRPL